MSAAPATRRAAAEIEGQAALFRIGNRSIHQFWHLFAAHFRHVLLAPQRRPDSGRVAWTWREDAEPRPVTATELTEVRRRLSEANRSLTRGADDLDSGDETADGAETIEIQVQRAVGEMVGQLVALRDAALSGFVCRTDAGLMLHSWGASSPAKPFFPDAQHGEVSGTVIIGTEHPPGVTVALENPQGVGLMRTHSDREGAFHFSNVAPGHYRVRVLDRSEFGAEGIEITMDRDSITGLELRGKVAGLDAQESTPAPGESVGFPPRHKRKWVGIVAVLGVLGIGGCIWNSTRTSTRQNSKQAKDASWQSAKGSLPDNGVKTLRDDRKVGTEGAFSSLSDSVSSPKVSPSTGHTATAFTGSKNSEANLNEDSDATGNPGNPESKKPSPDVADKGNEDNVPSEKKKPATAPSPLSSLDKTAGAQRPDAEKANAAEEAERPVSGTKQDDALRPTPDGKLPSEHGAKNSTNESSASSPSADTASEIKPDQSTQGPGALPKDASAKPTQKKKPSAKSESAGPASAAGVETSDAQKLDGPPENDASFNASPNRSMPKNPELPGATPNGTDSPSTAGSTAPNDAPPSPAAEETVDAGRPNPSPKGNPPGKAPASPSKSRPSADKPKSDAANKRDDQSDSNAIDGRAKLQPRKGAEQKDSAASAPAGSAGNSAGVPDGSETSPAVANEASDTNSKRAPAAKKSGSQSSSPTQSREGLPEGQENPPGKVSGIDRSTRATLDDAGLVQIGRILSSPWKVRLVQDLIIPTRPLTAREEEAVTALRQKLRKERTDRMPEYFQTPRMKSGLMVELRDGILSETDALQWHDESGKAIGEPVGRGRVAELGWEGAVPPHGKTYMLHDSAGKMLVRVKVDPTGGLTLKTISNARVRYWVGIEAGSTLNPLRHALEWRLLSEETIPASWSRDDAWLAGKGKRIEIPLDAASKRTGHYGVSLVDSNSGWALAGDITVQ